MKGEMSVERIGASHLYRYIHRGLGGQTSCGIGVVLGKMMWEDNSNID